MLFDQGYKPSFDWAQEWRNRSTKRNRADSVEMWNNRAPSFAKTAGVSPYARTFLEYAGVREGETVFDMGAGSGTLALPLARDGFEVFAGDFSPVMLGLMMERAKLEGIDHLITTKVMAWEDEWDAPVCDVAFASRSIATDDLEVALLKLEGQARRRVCLTMANGINPHVDNVLDKLIHPDRIYMPEYMYAVNILWQLGRRPELRLIHGGKDAVYESPEHALEKNAEYMECTAEEREVLKRYIDGHLVEATDGSGYVFTHKRTTIWGFVSWDL